MSNATVQAGRRRSFPARVLDLEHRPKPQQARLVLVATAGMLAAGLLIWMLCWIGVDGGIDVVSVAHTGPVDPILPYPEGDLGRLSLALRPEDPGRDRRPPVQDATEEKTAAVAEKKALRQPETRGPQSTPYTSLARKLEQILARAGRRPVTIYLSAAGVSDRSAAQAYLLPSVEGSLATIKPEQDLVTVEELLALCRTYEDAPKLLILDTGQVGSDRNLGVFANGFAYRLWQAVRAKPPRNLALLSACAPGQTSWGSEVDHCSVFAHYVARGLSGRAAGWDPGRRSGITVQGLANYVRHHVCQWVWSHRQEAVQTPELLGDPAMNFTLRKLPPGLAEPVSPADPEAVQALWKRMDEAWKGRDVRAARAPGSGDPMHWRRYLETLLRAERLIRAGQDLQAYSALKDLEALEAALDRPASSERPRFRSLAMAVRHLPAGPRSPARDVLDAANEALDRELKELTTPAEPSGGPPPPPEAPGQPMPPEAETPAAAVPTPTAIAPARPVRPSGPRRARGPGGDADETVPDWVEEQLLVWAQAFVRDDGDFTGYRGELLVRAMVVRRQAEEVTARPERVLRRIAPLVEAADARRRKAQDLLFASGGEPFQQAVDGFNAAEDLYQEALRGAKTCDQALDLVQQLAAELPYYGEWLVRSRTRQGKAPDEAMEPLLSAVGGLARVIAPDVREGSSSRGGDGLSRCREQIAALAKQYNTARDAFERLREAFVADCDRLKGTTVAGRWREIDDLLCVPLIPSGTRLALLGGVRSDAVASSLVGDADRPVPRNKADLAGLGLPEGSLGAAALPESVEAEGTAPALPSDPAFWGQALGLARLEQGLLELGGADPKRLDEIGSALDIARKVHGPARFDAFEHLSASIRALRITQLERIERARRALTEDDAEAEEDLVAADRAARTLPLADILRAGEPTERLDGFRRYALLLWHGRRLLEDFAPRHAQVLLDDARGLWTETVALRTADDKARQMKEARLAVAPLPAAGLTIDGWANQPLSVEVKAVKDVPAGDSVVSIGRGPNDPLTITEEASGRDAREGALVAVGQDAVGTVRYKAARTQPDKAQLSLSPNAFYRGRIYRSGTLGLSLQPVVEPISIALRQDYEPLQNRNFIDQFLEHPNDCYMHPGGFMFYKVVVTNNTDDRLQLDVQVDVDWKKAPQPDKRGLLLNAGKPGEIKGKVTYSEVPIGPPKKMTVTVKDQANKLKTFQREFQFHQIPAEQYMTASAGVTPDNVFFFNIHHLGSDPVTGWSEIEPWVTTTSQIVPIGVPVGTAPGLKIRILRGDTVNFSGKIVGPPAEITWSVHVEKDPKPLTGKISPPPPPGAPAAEGPRL